MTMSDYLENKDLDVWYGKIWSTIPNTLYLQLHSANPGETGVTGQLGIPRAAVTNNSTNWPAASGGSKTNGVKISFGSTAGQTFADATHISIWDAASGGNMLDYGSLNASVVVTDKAEVSITAGQLAIVRS